MKRVRTILAAGLIALAASQAAASWADVAWDMDVDAVIAQAGGNVVKAKDKKDLRIHKMRRLAAGTQMLGEHEYEVDYYFAKKPKTLTMVKIEPVDKANCDAMIAHFQAQLGAVEVEKKTRKLGEDAPELSVDHRRVFVWVGYRGIPAHMPVPRRISAKGVANGSRAVVAVEHDCFDARVHRVIVNRHHIVQLGKAFGAVLRLVLAHMIDAEELVVAKDNAINRRQRGGHAATSFARPSGRCATSSAKICSITRRLAAASAKVQRTRALRPSFRARVASMKSVSCAVYSMPRT